MLAASDRFSACINTGLEKRNKESYIENIISWIGTLQVIAMKLIETLAAIHYYLIYFTNSIDMLVLDFSIPNLSL